MCANVGAPEGRTWPGGSPSPGGPLAPAGPGLSHDQLVDRIMWEARRRKLKAHYCRSALRCTGPRGLPDLIIVGEHGILFAEIKVSGDTDAYQDEWIWFLTRAGARVFVWRESDLADGTIEKELEAIR